MTPNYPILYSFRRCPYAMRARLAIASSVITIEFREILLRNKPQQLIDISPKGTVPVLQLHEGKIIEESLDIMYWALSQSDKNNWLDNHIIKDIQQLIQWNDTEFKYSLDRYKYADRYPEYDEKYYREKSEPFLIELEARLCSHSFLCSDNVSLADIAIFPFIRQFSNVDSDWFLTSKYQKLHLWLNKFIESNLFTSIMQKYPAWDANETETLNIPLITNFNCNILD